MTTATIPSSMNSEDALPASPAPNMPSAGSPRCPKISAQPMPRLNGIASITTITPHMGRSSAEM